MGREITLDTITVGTNFDVFRVEKYLREFGVAVLPGYLSGEVLSELIREFELALVDTDDSYAYQIAYDPGRAVSIMTANMPPNRYPAIARVFRDDNFRRLSELYVGRDHLLNYEVYATHEHLPGVDVAPTHFDKLWTLKFMIYLQPVDAFDAPFGVVPGSAPSNRQRFRDIFSTHGIKKLRMDDERYQSMNNRAPEDARVVDITGPAGTLIVFDTDTFHHAGQVEHGHERMILRGHTGPSVAYESVYKWSSQWYRGERTPSKMDSLRYGIIKRFL